VALRTTYPNGTVTFDVTTQNDTGDPMELELAVSYCVLTDGQSDVVGTIAGGGTADGIAAVAGVDGAYIVENWPLGGTAGTGVLMVTWYGVGTDGGTFSPYQENIYNIIPASTNGYCRLTDLPKYGLEGATNYYDSDDEGNSYIEQGWRWINARLEAILPDVAVPVATTSSGEYDQHLISCNAYITNYFLADSRHRGEYLEPPLWIQDFKESAEAILLAIGSSNVVLEEQTSLVESGIGPVTAGTTNTGNGTMHTDRYGFKGVYLGYDFERTYYVEIDAASGDKDLDDCTFKWSMDSGLTWENTGVTCATSWTHLSNNVHIRFARAGGTTDQFAVGDNWRFTCMPLRKKVAGGPRVAKTVRGRRG